MNYVLVRSTIEGDPTLLGHFDDVKALSSDPDSPASDAAIAAITDWFAAADVVDVDVSVATLAGHIELAGLFEKLETAPPSNATAKKLLRIVSNASPISSISMSNLATRSAIITMVEQLVADSVWNQGEADGVLALAVEARTRNEALGLGDTVARGTLLLLKEGRA